MTLLLSFLASFSEYESQKSIGHSPIWHRKFADAPTICWFASIYTHQIKLPSHFTGLYSDSNTPKSSGFTGLRQPQLPLETEHVPEENSEFWAVTKKNSIIFHFVLDILQWPKSSGRYCCNPWGTGIRSALSWPYYLWFWDKNQRPLT